jgi:hypothetical protein
MARFEDWWRTQSLSNPSPISNSLLTGKRTGNFAEIGDFRGSQGLDTRANSKVSSQIPYASHQGIFLKYQGNIRQDQGMSSHIVVL